MPVPDGPPSPTLKPASSPNRGLRSRWPSGRPQPSILLVDADPPGPRSAMDRGCRSAHARARLDRSCAAPKQGWQAGEPRPSGLASLRVGITLQSMRVGTTRHIQEVSPPAVPRPRRHYCRAPKLSSGALKSRSPLGACPLARTRTPNSRHHARVQPPRQFTPGPSLARSPRGEATGRPKPFVGFLRLVGGTSSSVTIERVLIGWLPPSM